MLKSKWPSLTTRLHSLVSVLHTVFVPDLHTVFVPDLHAVWVPDLHAVWVPDLHPVWVPDLHPVWVPDLHTVLVPDLHAVSVPDPIWRSHPHKRVSILSCWLTNFVWQSLCCYALWEGRLRVQRCEDSKTAANDISFVFVLLCKHMPYMKAVCSLCW